jgi:hypothetical protein
MSSDIDGEWDCELDPERACMTCGGDGFVESVSQASGRYGWDDDGPGDCPNCGGSGNAEDQRWW